MNDSEKMIPESFFDKFAEYTGDGKDFGFIAFYINRDGEVVMNSRCSKTIIALGLKKCLEDFASGDFEYPGDTDDEDKGGSKEI